MRRTLLLILLAVCCNKTNGADAQDAVVIDPAEQALPTADKSQQPSRDIVPAEPAEVYALAELSADITTVSGQIAKERVLIEQEAAKRLSKYASKLGKLTEQRMALVGAMAKKRGLDPDCYLPIIPNEALKEQCKQRVALWGVDKQGRIMFQVLEETPAAVP